MTTNPSLPSRQWESRGSGGCFAVLPCKAASTRRPAVGWTRSPDHGFGLRRGVAANEVSWWIVSTNIARSLVKFGSLAPPFRSSIRETPILLDCTPKRPRREGARHGERLACCFHTPITRLRRVTANGLRRNTSRRPGFGDSLIFVLDPCVVLSEGGRKARLGLRRDRGEDRESLATDRRSRRPKPSPPPIKARLLRELRDQGRHRRGRLIPPLAQNTT